jgi:hypothetical protein
LKITTLYPFININLYHYSTVTKSFRKKTKSIILHMALRVGCEKLKLPVEYEGVSSFAMGKGLDNKVYIYGGSCINTPYTGRFSVFDTNNLTFTTAPDNFLSQRKNFSHCMLPSGVWVIGGGESPDPVDFLFIILVTPDEQVRRVATHGTIPPNRYAAPMKYLGKNDQNQDEIVLFGGNLPPKFPYLRNSNEIYVLNVDTLEWRQLAFDGSSPSPVPRYWCELFVIDYNTIAIFGGFSGDLSEYEEQDRYHNDIWTFNMETCVWTLLPNHSPEDQSPIGRGNFVATMRSNWLIVVGGYAPTRAELNDAWAFNVESCEWQQLIVEGDQFPAVWGHAWVELEHGRMLAFGGEGGWNEGARNMNADFYLYTFHSLYSVKKAKH